jgi:hypothetical protein
MYSVYQPWDPLKVCIVGRSYPPEFYSWITVPHVRNLFEKIAIETEEDYQNIIKKLQNFGVEVLRPDLPVATFVNNIHVPPPMTPRDTTLIIGNKFHTIYGNVDHTVKLFYKNVKDDSWPECNNLDDFYNLPIHIQNECKDQHNFDQHITSHNPYTNIVNHVKKQGNQIITPENQHININGAMVTRIGKDLYFGTESYHNKLEDIEKSVSNQFPDYRTHVINTNGHNDGVYCPVCPGLIISLRDIPTYKHTFPNWEVVYLPNQSWAKVKPFLELKEKNKGRWWIPGFEHDHDVINVVEQWMSHWTGYVEETVFDVNMLIIDPKNVMVFNYNKQVFDALDRYGITPHIVPFRHRYFWDGGIHCVTSDLHREGTMQDYFPQRG